VVDACLEQPGIRLSLCRRWRRWVREEGSRTYQVQDALLIDEKGAVDLGPSTAHFATRRYLAGIRSVAGRVGRPEGRDSGNPSVVLGPADWFNGTDLFHTPTTNASIPPPPSTSWMCAM
jgi:hypothetical protein